MTALAAISKAPKMLIADDDPSIVKLLAMRCANVGFEVETATNGINALIRANRTAPDVLIIDVNMPEADGLSVCAHLLDSAKKRLEVVVVTGSPDPETIERCEGFGAFYARKGPDFWTSLATALTEIFPEMADSIKGLETPPNGAAVRRRPCVLVVDDDAYTSEFLIRKLDKFAVDTLRATDALQGYRTACKEAPSVIICKDFIPNGDANYLLSRLRTTPATENIPVFVLSDHPLDEISENNLMREICGHPGAARIFTKFVNTDQLFDAIHDFCGFDSIPAAK